MRRIAGALLGAIILTGCVDAGIPTPGNGKGREGWYEIRDPETKERFNCFWWSLSDSTAMWCHPLPKEVGP